MAVLPNRSRRHAQGVDISPNVRPRSTKAEAILGELPERNRMKVENASRSRLQLGWRAAREIPGIGHAAEFYTVKARSSVSCRRRRKQHLDKATSLRQGLPTSVDKTARVIVIHNNDADRAVANISALGQVSSERDNRQE